MKTRPLFALMLATALASPALFAQNTLNFPHLGDLVKLDPALDELIDPDAKIEVLTSGFEWAEGPVWVADAEADTGGYVLFSDIPNNRVMKWQEGIGVSVWMKPAGYTGVADYGGEPGSNGLTLNAEGRVLFCEHGDRRVSMLTEGGGKITLADHYEGKRFNSPNDLVVHSSGDIYFTDPPYGLPGRWESEYRELDFCGVYRLSQDGEVTLLTTEMTRPNGLAFSPDEKTLLVANSDSDMAIWKAFPVKEDGTLGEGEVLFDATKEAKDPELKGGCDGLKVDADGNIFATGPGGVWVFTPEGKALGRIHTGERTANCAWGDDGTVLYMTADMYLCRIQTKTKGAGW